jgi:hypothetical protein
MSDPERAEAAPGGVSSLAVSWPARVAPRCAPGSLAT